MMKEKVILGVQRMVRGGGLHIVRGVPVIRGRCAFPVSPACSGMHQLPCAVEHLKLTGI